MTDKDTPTTKRYTVPEAAKTLGIGTDAARKRVSRGTITHDKDAGGVSTSTWTAGMTKGMTRNAQILVQILPWSSPCESKLATCRASSQPVTRSYARGQRS